MEFRAIDSYSLKARYSPTVILLSPLCLAVFAAGSGLWDPLSGLAASLVTVLGCAFVMDQVGRDQGKKKEPYLFQLWGGKPSTRILRHRDSTLDAVTRRRYHKKLSVLVDGIIMPSEKDEAENPEAADAVYDSCAGFLRQNTRGKEFRLLYQENTNYGFRRNLWGMRSAGIFVSIVGSLGCAGVTAWFVWEGSDKWLIAAVCFAISIVQAVLWIFRFTSDWVRTTAEEYARQLVATCDSLAGTANKQQ